MMNTITLTTDQLWAVARGADSFGLNRLQSLTIRPFEKEVGDGSVRVNWHLANGDSVEGVTIDIRGNKVS